MTGIPNFNYPKFNAVAERLRAEGHTVLNPAEIEDPDIVKDWHEYIISDLYRIARIKVDTVLMLKGWKNSAGAQIEKLFCEKLGCEVMYE